LSEDVRGPKRKARKKRDSGGAGEALCVGHSQEKTPACTEAFPDCLFSFEQYL
jgi:hypothetical protein